MGIKIEGEEGAERLKRVKVSAPGKIILSGEHAVVYGYPAILSAVDRRLSIELSIKKGDLEVLTQHSSTEHAEYGIKRVVKEIGGGTSGIKAEIYSQIPVGSGMGSSAALAVALTAALFKLRGQPWDLERINQVAYEIEKKQHGKPSGGDNTIVTYGGFLEFKKNADGSPNFSHISTEEHLSGLFVVNSGRPEETTREMVSMVGQLYENDKKRVGDIFEKIGQITFIFSRYLRGEGDIDVTELIRENQRLLERLGVVSPSAQNIVGEIEKIGGAAKISGAGGRKSGSGIILAYHKDPQKLLSLAKEMSLDIFSVKLGEEGVRWEKR